ncbi:hypothetical protein NGRA_2326 [Nosema granulosis]|uniref:MULE transposase domain-containing protein n=1 Tax=Nosema granulosis TaxID=83296 RepID=A0A9P6GZK7_9MICR|nr:hypothetical protein NGRA_2326 [Nosema granulosis]
MSKTITCLVGVLNPTVIQTDFEIPAITALTSIWLNTRINGCLFHLGQAIDRKIKDLNLSNIYATNFAFKKFTRALIALAYVKFDQLEEEFLLLKEHDSFPGLIIPLYNYLYNNYCRRVSIT